MIAEPALLDSDTLSELSRGNARVVKRARAYLEIHGRLTLAAVSVFERLRGYRAAVAEGKPYGQQLSQFQALVASSVILPFDTAAADLAADIWAGLKRRQRRALGDILIAATAAARKLPLVTRNRRDFTPIAGLGFSGLRLLDWSR